MIEILVSATVLMIVILCLRLLTKGRVSMRLRYALWLLVALRLAVPISFGSSQFSLMNLAGRLEEDVLAGHIREDSIWSGAAGQKAGVRKEAQEAGSGQGSYDIPVGGAELTADSETAIRQSSIAGDAAEAVRPLPDRSYGPAEKIRIRTILVCLWAAGMLAVGGHMLVCQIRFVRRLHDRRVKVPSGQLPAGWGRRLMARQMRVYRIAGLPSPCLVGRDIYIGPEILEDESRLVHVLAHEYGHAVQGDAFWAVVRSVLCVVYWFYAPVWAAAWTAKKDSELACDERAIGLLGEAERFAYGRTLLALLPAGKKTGGYAGAVLLMNGRKNQVKERISMIAGQRRKSRMITALVLAVAVLMCGCAFAGAGQQEAGGNGKEILLTNKAGVKEAEAAEKPQEPEANEPKTSEPDAASDLTGASAEETAAAGQQAAFEKMLFGMEDAGLTEAEEVDYEAWMNSQYDGADAPLKDGTWYRIPQEETGIEFYGLYTETYGFRGVKIRIGDDVNTFDQIWLPAFHPVKVQILEEDNGLPRRFVYAMITVNSSTEEKWQLYVADRYDTGTIELAGLDGETCRRLLEEKQIELVVDQEAKKVRIMLEGDREAGTLDIQEFAGGKVEEAVWDEGSIGYALGEDGKVVLLQAIGLKEAGDTEAHFGGLPLISFPVNIGTFGEQEITLGDPYVEEIFLSGRVG